MEEEIQRNYATQTVSNKILSDSLEDIPLESILERAISHIVSLSWLALEAKGAIFLVEEESKMLVLKAQHNLPKTLQEMCARLPFDQCLCGRAASSGEVVSADDVDEQYKNRYEGISPHGHYCVPIISPAKKTLGVINRALLKIRQDWVVLVPGRHDISPYV